MRNKYGEMPSPFQGTAKVKGDAGEYKVWGFDWINQMVLVDRAGMAWLPINKVCLTANKHAKTQHERDCAFCLDNFQRVQEDCTSAISPSQTVQVLEHWKYDVESAIKAVEMRGGESGTLKGLREILEYVSAANPGTKEKVNDQSQK